MADIEVVGIQKAEFGFEEPALGALISGIAYGQPVLAIAAHDNEGRFYLAFESSKGRISMLNDTQISEMQVVEGVLYIEPADGQVPFALPVAAATASHALVVTADGEVGIQVNVSEGGQKFTAQTNLRTGTPMGNSKRRLLTNFKVSLKVEDREKPILVGNF